MKRPRARAEPLPASRSTAASRAPRPFSADADRPPSVPQPDRRGPTAHDFGALVVSRQPEPVDDGPIMQRFVYDADNRVIRARPAWLDVEDAEGKKVSAALDDNNTGFKNYEVQGAVTDAWGVDYGTTVSTANPVSSLVDPYINNRLSMAKVEAAAIVSHFRDTKNQEPHHTMEQRLQTTQASRTSYFTNNVGSQQRATDRVTALRNGLEAVVGRELDPAFYLYRFSANQLADFYENRNQIEAAAEKPAEPILHPAAFTESDDQSSVDFEFDEGETLWDENYEAKRQKVCLLIAMVYERAVAAGGVPAAKDYIKALFEEQGVEIDRSKIKPKAETNYLPDNKNLYDVLVTELHDKLHGDEVLYDMEKHNLAILRKSYTCIVSANCAWRDLPANMPVGVSLDQGSTYVVLIDGHATTIKMKETVTGQMGVNNPPVIANWANTFQTYNESSFNYDKNVNAKNVQSIWTKTGG